MPATLKTVAISGAGSGLGAGMARYFATRGYAVAVTDQYEARANAVLEEIHASGGKGFAMALDVREARDWDALYERVTSEWGGLDVLINNAGVAGGGRIEEGSLDDWLWVLDINLKGVVQGCRRFLPLMRKQRQGYLINIASFAGLTAVPGLSSYATAKAAVVALSEQLRVDLSGSGVGISVVCPAFVQTGLLDEARFADARQRNMASKLMQRSDISSDDIAEMVFRAMQAEKFLVLTHPQTRWAWRLRRWLPEFYHRRLLALNRNTHGSKTS